MSKIIFILSLFIWVPAGAVPSFDVVVTRKGFHPATLEAEPNEKITLNITRKVNATCAKKITIPSENIEKDLPLNKSVAVELTTKNKGEIKFGCAMDQMLGGVIRVN